MIHLEQVIANDTHLAELTGERKKTIEEPARGRQRRRMYKNVLPRS